MLVQIRKTMNEISDQVCVNNEILVSVKNINPAQCSFPLKIFLKTNKTMASARIFSNLDAKNIPKPKNLDTIYIKTGYPTGQAAKNDFPSGT
jgi:hypothetical protein